MKSHKTISILLATASCLAVAYGSAHAAEQSGTAAPAAAPATQDPTVVVVTAFKRAQSTLTVPAAISAISGNDLKAAGVTRVDDIQNIAPSVNINRNGFGVVTNIRGVTTTDTTSKGEQGIAFNIDGIYYARPVQQGLAFFDVERVEILRGPVGTLYGKSSTGGALNILTNKPSLTGYAASASLELGNYNTRRLQAMVNVPLSDHWAVRAAINSNKRDGYLTPVDGTVANGFYTSAAGLPALNDEDNQTGRLSVLYKPNTDTSFRLTATGGHNGGYGLGEAIGDILDAAGEKGKDALNIVPNPIQTTKFNDNFVNLDGQADFRIGGVAVTYQAAYQHFNAHDPVAVDNNPQANDFSGLGNPLYAFADLRWNMHTVEHEIRISNAEPGKIDYVAGVNYVREHIDEGTHNWTVPVATYEDTSTWNNALGFLNKTIHTSAGIFGQATWHATSKLDFIVGLRESDDSLTRVGTFAAGPAASYAPYTPWFDADGNVCHYPNACIGKEAGGAASSQKLTYRAGINYHLSPTNMIYGSVATGYKAGGFNDYDPVANGPASYDPEQMTAYEIGYKGRPLAGLTYTTSAFYYDYSGDQITSRVLFNGSMVLYTRLVPVTIYGWEHELSYRLSPNTNVKLAGTFEHSEFKHFMAGALQNVDWTGKSLDQTPDFAGTASINHTFTLSGGAAIRLNGATKYSSGYYLSDFVNAVQIKQKAFTRTDASISFTPANGHYSLEAFVQNIEDKVQKIGQPETYSATLANATTFPVSTPRFYGMRINLTY